MKPKNYEQQSNPEFETIPLDECLAKTYINCDGVPLRGRSVIDHSLIAGCIALKLIDMAPPWLFENSLNGTHIPAALHDIGKITPIFQYKLHNYIGSIPNSLSFFAKHLDIEKLYGYHAGAGQLALKSENPNINIFSKIVGRHHGKNNPTALSSPDAEQLGGKSWQQMREEFRKRILDYFGYQDIPPIFQNKGEDFIRYVSGLTVVSDWLASSDIFDNPDEDWSIKIDGLLENIGFINPEIKKGLTFSEIFGFKPRNEQTLLYENCFDKGVYVLEAQMGMGKTEAALYLAYKMLEKGDASGIYFALPTRLTSNKIYDRFNNFLKKILSSNMGGLLVHGDSFHKAYFESPEVSGEIDASWFMSSKRAVLYPFAVGTIDQALMSVLNVKHNFVRSYGLAGKVVILDEVHSYDIYTGTIIDNLVKSLLNMGCTIIILSATLTSERKRALLSIEKREMSYCYPLVSSVSEDFTLTSESPKTEVAIEFTTDEIALVEKAIEAADNGQQVLWIENTVEEAQSIFKRIKARVVSSELKIETGLLHSKFIKNDRDNIERKWTEVFGKDSPLRGDLGRILVGTQVLEQSLDIDSDMLITRLAPADMILQRIGRLWRHQSALRPKGALRKAYILSSFDGENIQKDAVSVFGKSAYVYSAYVLYQTYMTMNKYQKIIIPGDMRAIIEEVYNSDLPCNGFIAQWKAEMEKKAEDLKRFALNGLSDGDALSDEKASTRYSDEDSLTLLLLKSYAYKDGFVKIKFYTGQTVEFACGIRSKNKGKWSEIMALVSLNIISVPCRKAPNINNQEVSKWLKDFLYVSSSQGVCAGIALIDDAYNIADCSGNKDTNEKYILKYNSEFGYQSIKK